jgi:hypothetical protein
LSKHRKSENREEEIENKITINFSFPLNNFFDQYFNSFFIVLSIKRTTTKREVIKKKVKEEGNFAYNIKIELYNRDK